MDTESEAQSRSRMADVAARAGELADAGRRAARLAGRRTGEATAKGGQWAYAALASWEPPQVPAAEPWKLSVGALVGRHRRTPGVVRKALGLLDGFGAVAVGPKGVGFDGDDIEWDKVEEIRTRTAYEMLTTQALDREVDRLREFLPPVPGRKWVVTKATEVLTTVVLAALEQGSEDELGELTVPSEIVYRGLLGRRRTLSGGLFAVAVLTVVRPAGRSVLATAEQHDVKITEAEPLPDADRTRRTETLRRRTDAISQRLRALQRAAAETDAEAEAEGVLDAVPHEAGPGAEAAPAAAGTAPAAADQAPVPATRPGPPSAPVPGSAPAPVPEPASAPVPEPAAKEPGPRHLPEQPRP
ncbi:hypothetical protein [Streptomyces sp. HPF1205]|uniref:hypothetical protein n=1 Tax=Streptomyces sp. HPF1205 TaxID=2873262 RepID=UPI001CEC0AEE|nr:hypothetical protein [Streptomyces sp. HPF1205]